VTRAITTIAAGAFSAISYPHAVFDDAEQRRVSDAELAEVDVGAFTGRRKAEQVTCRLVVRRVKDSSPSPATAPPRASCSRPTATTPSSPTAP